MKRVAVIGFLGTTLDAGKGHERWSRWRPTVALCQHEDFLIHRLDLIHDKRFVALAKVVAEDIAQVSPETEVRLHEMNLRDPWDFEQVYRRAARFRARATLRHRDGGLSHPHHHRHPRGADLPVPADRGALLPRPACCRLSPPRAAHRQPAGQLFDHRPRPLAIRPHRQRASRRAGRGRFVPEVRHRDAQRRLQPHDRARSSAWRSRSKAPLLLTGPTGAGKSQLARRIFELKKARHQVPGSFVEVNCATLRGDAAMSTLFGHIKGAFTGAIADRAGLLRGADQGVLFLDEIGELGLDEQAMLLRAVEEKRFLPVGSDKEVDSDFQLIAGTNRDLGLAVRSGRFREDLLARLNLWTFRLPGLARAQGGHRAQPRIRAASAMPTRTAAPSPSTRRRGGAMSTSPPPPEADWSANFRDLGASVTRMATLAPGGRITEEIVDQEIARLRQQWRGADDDQVPRSLRSWDRTSWQSSTCSIACSCRAVLEICRECSSLSAAGRRCSRRPARPRRQQQRRRPPAQIPGALRAGLGGHPRVSHAPAIALQPSRHPSYDRCFIKL